MIAPGLTFFDFDSELDEYLPVRAGRLKDKQDRRTNKAGFPRSTEIDR